VAGAARWRAGLQCRQGDGSPTAREHLSAAIDLEVLGRGIHKESFDRGYRALERLAVLEEARPFPVED
jgi:hypothetical protein